MERILLVDGDTQTRRVLATFLGQRSFAVEQVPDPVSALQIVASARPDLVVTELFPDMPRFVDGLTRAAPGVPVLVWAAPLGRERRPEIERLGCELMSKPARPSDVAFRIARLLAGVPGPEIDRAARPQRLATGSDVLFTGPATPGA